MPSRLNLSATQSAKATKEATASRPARLQLIFVASLATNGVVEVGFVVGAVTEELPETTGVVGTEAVGALAPDVVAVVDVVPLVEAMKPLQRPLLQVLKAH